MLYCSDQIVIWWIVISKDFVIYYSDWFLMWCIAGTRVFCDIHVIEKKIHCSDQNIFLINYRDKILGCYIAVTKLLFDELWCPEFSWFITETDFLCDVLQGLQSFVIYMQLKKIFTAQTKTYFDKLQRQNSWMLYCSDQIVMWWIVMSKVFAMYCSDWFLMWCIAGTIVFFDIHVQCHWKKKYSLLRPKHIFDKLPRPNSWMFNCSDQIEKKKQKKTKQQQKYRKNSHFKYFSFFCVIYCRAEFFCVVYWHCRGQTARRL